MSIRPLTLSTQKLYITKESCRFCTHARISISYVVVPSFKLFGSLGILVKNVDTSVSNTILIARVFSSKSWVWNGIVPLKPNKWIAIEAVGEHCQSIGRVSKLHPCSKFSFFPEMLIIKENSTFKSLGRRDILHEVLKPEGSSIDVI